MGKTKRQASWIFAGGNIMAELGLTKSLHSWIRLTYSNSSGLRCRCFQKRPRKEQNCAYGCVLFSSQARPFSRLLARSRRKRLLLRLQFYEKVFMYDQAAIACVRSCTRRKNVFRFFDANKPSLKNVKWFKINPRVLHHAANSESLK